MQKTVSPSSYDLIADRFQAIRTTLRGNEEAYLTMVLDALPPGSKVLDLGCGAGHPIATHIAARGYQVTGVDGSAAMLAYAQKHLPGHRWILAALEEVDFAETFHAVICWDSLFHLPRHHFAPVFRKIHRWLAPGGCLMVSSGGVVDEEGEGFTDTMFGHEFYYDSLSPRQMREVLEGAGFEILRGEMCDLPDGGRDKGKWATIARRTTSDD